MRNKDLDKAITELAIFRGWSYKRAKREAWKVLIAFDKYIKDE